MPVRSLIVDPRGLAGVHHFAFKRGDGRRAVDRPATGPASLAAPARRPAMNWLDTRPSPRWRSQKKPTSGDGRLRACGFGLSPPTSAVARWQGEITPDVDAGASTGLQAEETNTLRKAEANEKAQYHRRIDCGRVRSPFNREFGWLARNLLRPKPGARRRKQEQDGNYYHAENPLKNEYDKLASGRNLWRIERRGNNCNRSSQQHPPTRPVASCVDEVREK